MKATIHEPFAHHWQAMVLSTRPLIAPARQYTYPANVEEVERGALELLVQPAAGQPFLATCALGFADPLAPTGVWSCPNPDLLCAVAGGYAYLIDTREPSRWDQIAYRPVYQIHPASEAGLLLFVGSRNVLVHGEDGRQYESPRLSDEGVTITSVDATHAHGVGWQMATDREVRFSMRLRDGTLA